MIALILHDIRWRLLSLLGIAALLYALEPGFHQHEEFDLQSLYLGPLGVSATISYFAALTMIILLGGRISRDRQMGYTRLLFANPVSPVTYYGLRLAIAYAVAMIGSVLFLAVGQVIAWGTTPRGWMGLLLPLLTALVYGGLVTFLSAVMPRGDTFTAFLFFLPTFVPGILDVSLANASLPVRQIVLLILPPHGAVARVWEGLLDGQIAWIPALYAAAYGLILLVAAGVVLRTRELP